MAISLRTRAAADFFCAPATPAEIEAGVYAQDFDDYQKLTGKRAA
jgi:hypothetical protein